MEPDPIVARVASYRSPGARSSMRVTRLVALVPLVAGVVWAGACHEGRIGGPVMPTLLLQKAAVSSGDQQTDTVLATLSSPLRVLVLRDSLPAMGVTVTWRVPEGQGSVSESTTTTDAEGIASVMRTLGPTAGAHSTEASLVSAVGSRVTFSATARLRPSPAIVSDPVASLSPGGAGPAISLGEAAGAVVAYVSLPPGTIPSAEAAIIRNRATGSTDTAMITDGGFDPLPVAASAGDTLDIDVRLVGGGAGRSMLLTVPATRRPIVVRTNPPPRRRDVPLNASMVIVFSEPIASRTLTTSAVQLLRGTTPVAGHLEFRDAAQVSVAFVPDAPLAGSTTYTLVVTQGILDQDGEALEAPVAVEFTTASPVASVSVSPDVATVVIRDSLQLTAVARDSAGNVLTDRPVSWASSDSAIASVSPVGLVQGASAGSALIVASAEGKADTAAIVVTLGGRLVFSVQPTNMGAGLRITPVVQVTAQDALGRTITEYTGDVSVVIGANSAGGSLSGTTTVGAVAGVAMFADLRIDATGTGYTLVAAASGVIGGTSRAFSITPMAPVSGRIAFARCQNPNCQSPNYDMDIFVANADGSGEARLTNDTLANENYPAWAPDGTRIAYTSVTETGSLYSIGADGSGVIRLTTGQPRNHGDEDAAWSPDGAKIVFVSARDGGNRYLYIMKADGSEPRRVPNQPGTEAYGPVWSPDGTKIAYAELQTGVARYSIYVLNVDGSGVTRLTTPDGPAGSSMMPAWSPDGTKIAFTGTYGIWIMAADGSGATKLVNGTEPAWSPDGTRIAFTDWQAGNSDIYLMNADGSGVTRLTDDPGQDFLPAWGLSGSLPPPSVVAQLAISVQPTTTVVGQPIMPAVRVTARDVFGSTVSGYTGNVTIAIGANPGGAALSGTKTVGAVSGVATFADLRLDRAGTGYTLIATGSTLSSATSTAFDVTTVTRIVELQGNSGWDGDGNPLPPANRFVEDSVTVPAGIMVGWLWVCGGGDCSDVSLGDHNVTFEDEPTQPTSSATKSEGYHTRTFNAPGIYRYRCTLHSQSFRSGMVGMVVVR